MSKTWRDTFEWVGFCLLIELVVACFTGAEAIHSPHFGSRSMVVGALITAGILLLVTVALFVAAELIEESQNHLRGERS